jgi:hypothetical protein
VRRKAPAPTVDALRFLDTLWLNLSAFVIDDDEMQPRCLEEAREVVHPRIARSVFRLGDDVMRHTRTHCEFTLAQVGDGTRSPNVSIRREIAHEVSVADCRALSGTVSGLGTYRSRACGQPPDHCRGRFALFR